jgi:DNA-binding CsgD family transcriptional regulator
MKKIIDVYCELLKGYRKEDLTDSVPPDFLSIILMQSTKFIKTGIYVFNLQGNEYLNIKWPFEQNISIFKDLVDAESCYELIHPDEKLKITNGKIRAFRELKKMKREELHDHILTIECRLQYENSNYRLMLFRYLVLELDEKGGIKSFLVYMLPLNADTLKKKRGSVKLIDMSTDRVVFKSGRSYLSKENIELLRMAVQDLTSAELAKALGISVHAVNVRLSRIRELFECSSTKSAIFIAKDMGLL